MSGILIAVAAMGTEAAGPMASIFWPLTASAPSVKRPVAASTLPAIVKSSALASPASHAQASKIDAHRAVKRKPPSSVSPCQGVLILLLLQSKTRVNRERLPSG